MSEAVAASGERYLAGDTPETSPAVVASDPGILRCEDLFFRYGRSGAELFDGFSHEFSAGAITALLGPSGRGKSTLLYILGLMLTPGRGRIWLDGVPVSILPDAQRARIRASRIGFIFQDAALDPARRIIDSIIEPAIYAGIPRRMALAKGMELAEQIGVRARLDHKPGAISGGEAQRVAACRALLNDPDILLADEPTGNLDQDNSETVLGLLRQAADAGKSVVIATHDPFLMSAADETVWL